MLGVKRFIRTGTCGGIGRGLKTGDIVVATAAVPADGATRTYLHGDPFAPAADFEMTRALVDAARAKGVEPTVGVVQSVDVFYNSDSGLRVEDAQPRRGRRRDGGLRAVLPGDARAGQGQRRSAARAS